MFIIIYLLCFIFNFTMSTNQDLIITSGVDSVQPDSVAMMFYININNTGEDCQVECTPDRCCLSAEGGEDCDLLQIMGGCFEAVPGGTTKTIRMAAPLLNPFERQGYCIVYLDSRPEGREVVRDTIRIPFNTFLDKNPQANLRPCRHIDQDPLNNCKPVDCDTYYNGRKPYFSKRLQRCIEAPPCLSDELYDTIYNRCRRNTSVTEDDMKYIQSLAHGNRRGKDIFIINKHRKHHRPIAKEEKIDIDQDGLQKVDIDQDGLDKVDIDHDGLNSGDAVTNLHTNPSCKLLQYLSAYKDTLTVLGIVVLAQCIVIYIMMYCLTKHCECTKDKTLISRFFNYRQDVSVTTPLIATTNNDTETSYQYMSESSTSVDKKIKCYKACERNKPHNAKVSISDDILSKCLNRRDWTHKPQSDAVVEFKSELSKNSPENKVNFDEHIKESKTDARRSETDQCSVRKSDNIDINPSSEQEIQCHNYQEYQTHSVHNDTLRRKDSTDKGAQACFSNDSIDDFLSERGMLFLAGDNVSKYTFSSESTFNLNIKQSSDISDKTSKNNIVKSVLSMLYRKSKAVPSSDPGGKKDDNLDMELLHMSRASVFSSNAGDSRSSL